MVPGWAPSADPSEYSLPPSSGLESANSTTVLQARMFAYPDAARYRLGVNYQRLPTNRAAVPVYSPFQRDGFMNFTENYGDDPNYVGSMLHPTTFRASSLGARSGGGLSTVTEHEKWAGEVSNFTSEVGPEDFEQATALWEVLGRDGKHQDRFVGNVADHVSKVTNSKLRMKVYGTYVDILYFTRPDMIAIVELFSHVSKDLGKRISAATEAALS